MTSELEKENGMTTTATWLERSGPLLTSGWTTSGRLAFLAGMLGVAAITLPSIAIVFDDLGAAFQPLQLLFLGTTLLFTALVLGKVMRRCRRPEASAVGWALLFATLGGAANATTLVLVLSAGAGIVFLPYSLGLGAGFGFVFGLVLAPLLASWHRAVRVRNHGAVDDVALRAGLWLIATGAVALLLCADQHPGSFVLGLAVMAATGGAVLAALGGLRRARRRRWLARVVRGDDPAWLVAPRPQADVAAAPCGEGDMIPLARERDALAYDGVLVRRQDGVSGPYRSCGDGDAVALVRMPRPDAAPAAPRDVMLGLGATVAVGMAFVAGLAAARSVTVRYSDIGVFELEADLHRLLAGNLTFCILSIILLAVVWRLGRRRSVVWAVGAPLMGVGFLVMEVARRLPWVGF